MFLEAWSLFLGCDFGTKQAQNEWVGNAFVSIRENVDNQGFDCYNACAKERSMFYTNVRHVQ